MALTDIGIVEGVGPARKAVDGLRIVGRRADTGGTNDCSSKGVALSTGEAEKIIVESS